MYTITYETRYGDYKDFDTIKPGVILDIVQDISTKDAHRCGYSIHKLRKMNVAWLLQGISVRFEKPVKTLIPIVTETAVRKFKGATSERCCILKQNNEIVAKTTANWFIFDIINKRPSRISEDMISDYELYEFDDSFGYKKPQIFKIEKPEYTIQIRNKDLDTNMHLNNQKGAEILMDALPFDFYFDEINLLYKKPSFLGDELQVCKKELPNGYYVHLQTKDGEICVVGTFEKRV